MGCSFPGLPHAVLCSVPLVHSGGKLSPGSDHGPSPVYLEELWAVGRNLWAGKVQPGVGGLLHYLQALCPLQSCDLTACPRSKETSAQPPLSP